MTQQGKNAIDLVLAESLIELSAKKPIAVDASQLNLCDNVIDLSGYTATDPNIQQMGGLMAEADDAQKNENLDGSNQVTDIMASESTAESESTDTDSTDTESQPAA